MKYSEPNGVFLPLKNTQVLLLPTKEQVPPRNSIFITKVQQANSATETSKKVIYSCDF